MNTFSNRSILSTTTRKRIPGSEIRAGMFLVRILDSWWKSPFFVHRRLLRSQDVQQLVQSGIQEVEIDISKGLDVSPDSDANTLEDAREVQVETGTSNAGDDSFGPVPEQVSFKCHSPEQENQKLLIKLRGDAIAAIEGVFEGVKTGQTIPLHALHTTAQEFIQKALANPTVLAEILLIEQLEQFDKSLYSHVVDTAVLAILVGLQLGWDLTLLEEVTVAALLHDVGYMRLPLNLVQTRWGRTGIDRSLLQQHVSIGMALVSKNSGISKEIVQMVGGHHAYQDGSGYPNVQGGEPVSASGKLLGLADYFDELLAEGNTSGSFPVALAIRRMYQEAQNGKFPTLFVEAMIRVFGVYPVGTFVQLSTGDCAVVVKQNPGVSVKPHVKIIRARTGQIIGEAEVKNLALAADLGQEVSIVKVLNHVEYSINLREIFS
jgi:putative nucleotidyltransferase with HDIG domain